MENERLLACLAADFRRLRAVVSTADPSAVVPSCPEWTITDLVRHVAHVYLHKVVSIQTQAPPETWPPTGTADEEPIALLDRAFAELTAEFAAHEPAAPAYTWFAPDQSVGFWIRRMAQETVIHRVDAELGAGVPISPIPDDLARDGIDELLDVFVSYSSQVWFDGFAELLADAGSHALRIETDGVSWLVRPTAKSVEVSRVPAGTPADAVLTGPPTALLLHLWHRANDDGIHSTGDQDLVGQVHRIVTVATQ